MARVWRKIPIYRDNMPKYVVNGSVALYFLVMMALLLLFRAYFMHWYWWLIGAGCIITFFLGSKRVIQNTVFYSSHRFEKYIFRYALALRIMVVFLSYWFFYYMTGGYYDFAPADVEWYDEVASEIATRLLDGHWNIWESYNHIVGSKSGLDDAGYPMYLGVVYVLVGKSKLAARIIHSIWSAYICLFVYRIAQRHFEEPTARLAAVLCVFMPNLVLYCGLHLKEVVMTFLTVWFVERADAVMFNRNFSFRAIGSVALIGLSLFSFRTVLASVLFIAFAVALVFSSTHIIKGGRRVLLIFLSGVFVFVAYSGTIEEEVMQIVNQDIRGQQQTSMQLRYGSGRGAGGNRFVDNLGAAVFAPLIFTIPFPTMVETPTQEQMRYLHGGNYVKNVMSGFVIWSMFMMLLGGNIRSLDAEWRKHVLPISAYLGYLFVLVFSQFAHSERFHQPILPFAMLFAAYGITHFKPRQRWMWSLWMGVVFVMLMGWAYIKLKGRGL